MRRVVLAVGCLVLASCGKYEDFSLPSPPKSAALELNWKVRETPVMTRGTMLDVLNPSVVRWRNEYLNLYSVFDGKRWNTRVASSADGIAWQDRGEALNAGADYIAANGGVAEFTGKLFYAYQTGPKGKTEISVAVSNDGLKWSAQGGPILKIGPRMSWDEISLGDPYLMAVGNTLYLFYLGEDRARRQRLGMARSTDGLNWTKLRGPVMELGMAGDFDENGLGEPAVFAANGQWVMLYTGRDRQEKRAMGYATSMDGKMWLKQRQPVLRGEQPWNRAVICDATVLVEGDRARIWFGGGNLPKPDERLNGQIGYAELLKRD
ncbi:MAG: hypothetical protein FJW36_06985 [Acidobacteria bacterium]|nr:hypothetical protein [Acidobacteriota bacterium]